jgi:hypothetical protein
MVKSGCITKDVNLTSESLQEGQLKESTIMYRITTLGTRWLNNIIEAITSQ